MQFHKLDSRRLRVTDLPSTVEGLRVDATELEVLIAYVGDPSGRKAIVLDNVVVPLMLAAPALLERLQAMVSGAECECDTADPEHPLCDICWSRSVIAQATNEEVNA